MKFKLIIQYFRKIYRFIRPEFDKSYFRRNVRLHRTTQIVFSDRLEMGKYIYIGPKCFINAEGGVSIGDGTIIAPEVVVYSSTHNYKIGELIPYDIFDEYRPVKIGKGVWIGYGAMVSPGVSIGDGAVIAMGSVVVKDIAPGAVVGGNPATEISSRDDCRFHTLIAERRWFMREYWKKLPPRIAVEGLKK